MTAKSRLQLITKMLALFVALALIGTIGLRLADWWRSIKDAQYHGHNTSYWRECIIGDAAKRSMAGERPSDDLLWCGGDPDAVPVLIELTSDSDAVVRARAARALGKNKYWEIRIVRTLNRLKNDEDFYVRSDTAEALGEIKDKALLPLP
jgi:HEAT repeats